MYDFETNQDILELIDKCDDKQKIVEVLSYVHNECKRQEISFTDYQWKSVVNHISAMISRSITKEELEGIEESMLDEIGEESISFANEVVKIIGNIPEFEKYLLSVHFEVAKKN